MIILLQISNITSNQLLYNWTFGENPAGQNLANDLWWKRTVIGSKIRLSQFWMVESLLRTVLRNWNYYKMLIVMPFNVELFAAIIIGVGLLLKTSLKTTMKIFHQQPNENRFLFNKMIHTYTTAATSDSLHES